MSALYAGHRFQQHRFFLHVAWIFSKPQMPWNNKQKISG